MLANRVGVAASRILLIRFLEAANLARLAASLILFLNWRKYRASKMGTSLNAIVHQICKEYYKYYLFIEGGERWADTSSDYVVI